MRYLLAFISLLWITPTFVLATPKGQLVDRMVAVVNGKIILWSELKEKSKEVASKVGSGPDVERRVLDQMINDLLVSEEIGRRGLSAPESTIDAAISSVMKQNRMRSVAELEKALKNEGMTLEEYRTSLKKQIETSRLLNDAVRSRISISDQDVASEFKKSSTQNGKTNSMKVRMIYTKGKDKKRATRLLKEIKAGIPFERVADRETDGPGKGDGGSIGSVSPEDMQPELAKVLKTMKPGDISPVIATKTGYYILNFVDYASKESSTEPTAGQREELKEKLTEQETNKGFENLIQGLRSKAHIEVLLN